MALVYGQAYIYLGKKCFTKAAALEMYLFFWEFLCNVILNMTPLFSFSFKYAPLAYSLMILNLQDRHLIFKLLPMLSTSV